MDYTKFREMAEKPFSQPTGITRKDEDDLWDYLKENLERNGGSPSLEASIISVLLREATAAKRKLKMLEDAGVEIPTNEEVF